MTPRDLESGGYGSGEVIKGDHPCVPNTSPPPPAVQSARCPQEMELVTYRLLRRTWRGPPKSSVPPHALAPPPSGRKSGERGPWEGLLSSGPSRL